MILLVKKPPSQKKYQHYIRLKVFKNQLAFAKTTLFLYYKFYCRNICRCLYFIKEDKYSLSIVANLVVDINNLLVNKSMQGCESVKLLPFMLIGW